VVQSWIRHCIVQRISPNSDSGQLYLQITSKKYLLLKIQNTNLPQAWPKPSFQHAQLSEYLEKILKTILWPEKDGKKVDHGCHRSQYLYELLPPIVQNII